jgi:hypothetical protein
MRPYLITAKLMRPSNMKRFPTPGLHYQQGHKIAANRVKSIIYLDTQPR